MARRKTHEQFMKDFYERNKNAENIEILEGYINKRTKIKCRCKIDNHIWTPTPDTLLNQGSGCPKCSGNMKKTHKQFIKELSEINSDIEVLGEYVNSQTKIKCRCRIDKHEWRVIPNDLLRGFGCPMCGGVARKTTEQFIKELSEINSDIEVLGEYINNKTPIKCRCKIDNYEWEVVPCSLLNQGSGCPKCNSSKGERRVVKYLGEHNIENIHDKGCFKDLLSEDGRVLRPDFIIEDKKIWIEFDGIQHFEPRDFANKGKEWAEEQFKITQANDKIKDEYAKENDWNLIRIPYWEFNNIEKILDKIF